MLILGVIAALLMIVLAHVLGEHQGEANGYERGLVDGNLEGRKQLAFEAAEDRRRQREETERAHHQEVGRKVIDSDPGVEAALTAVPEIAAKNANVTGIGKRKRRR